MDVRQQDVERIVVEVLKKMMSDQPTAAATTVVAASGCDIYGPDVRLSEPGWCL